MSVSPGEQTYRDITKEPEVALAMRDQLREARTKALDDAEGFQVIIWAIERLGHLITRGRELTLAGYESALRTLAKNSSLAEANPATRREWHAPFSVLYKVVQTGRNDALHQGAFARHLTEHAILLSLILEDALMANLTTVSDYMVRNPVIAYPWQPVSFARQQMLANSFSNIPVYIMNGDHEGWHLISDHSVAYFLRAGSFAERNDRLSVTVADAVKAGMIKLTWPDIRFGDAKIDEVLGELEAGLPLLIVNRDMPKHLLGILTPFDLL